MMRQDLLNPGPLYPPNAAGQDRLAMVDWVRRSGARVLLLLVLWASAGGEAKAVDPIRYTIDLREPSSHLVRVSMSVTGSTAPVEIQFPAWNALYQIRDFVENVQDLEAACD